MAINDNSIGVNLEELFYIGIVTAYGKAPCTVRVRRPDKDDRVSAELPVIQLCVQGNSFFHMPKIDEQVLCIALPNAGGKGVGEGFCLGAWYSEEDKPTEIDNDTISLTMENGSYLRFNKNGDVELHAAQNFLITVGGQVRIDRR